MSQTILIEPKDDLRKIFSLNLSTFVGTDIIIRKGSDDTIALLKLLPQVDLIITRARVNQEETALKIFNYIQAEGLSTGMIVLGESPQLATKVLCLSEPVSWELLIKQTAQILGVTVQHASEKIKPEFYPVGIHYFYDINQTPCDVYIRIKKSNNEYQFVKRIHSKDEFDRAAIDNYEEQGLKEFYIAKDYIQYFTTFVTNSLVQRLEQTDLSLEDRILTTAIGHEIVREKIKNSGLDEASIQLSGAAIQSMVKSVKDSPQLISLLKFLFSNKVSYAYQHCHMQALLCHYILLKQSWYEEEHLEVLSFASFFCDLTLFTQEQMQISSIKELMASGLNEEERKVVLSHPRDVINLISKHPELNDYSRTVILQSHGKKSGVGFEEDPEEDLHSLSKVFIVADSFVKILLNPALPSNKNEILPLLYERFTRPSYQKIIKALESKFQ